MAQVEAIKAYKDNYIWALQGSDNKQVVVVDPGLAEPVFAYLKEQNKTLAAILITHHHWDHTTGVAALKLAYPGITVYGPKNSPFTDVDVALSDGDTLKVLNYDFQVRATPGHTLDHICYFGAGLVFSGDTLFSGGCGRLFEGSAEQMWQSMQVFRALDDKTLVYCTHEYTQANMQFAAASQPHNEAVLSYQHQVETKRAQDIITLPSTIGLEKRINPFLRADVISLGAIPPQFRPQDDEPNAKFAALRAWKDNF
ncbi:hydroxyacylglutathione hydrolase [Pseudoalteromonas sp. BDTF-M6]|uniref:hydroxyacylglutathione hydrolase n=1 Tax=Pseudoalteromonas sp. BDTF-M6 TaxID=2796132 RepID=UPI001BB03C8A|nr:hydroxyacylglutathione hydrolase [Pseudoalteromonas sp. BDTF-M6]MBS3798616.1 hydroxyacylglutathione hydrolase [Pseudoalteromonas sp. BDTF-M6]